MVGLGLSRLMVQEVAASVSLLLMNWSNYGSKVIKKMPNSNITKDCKVMISHIYSSPFLSELGPSILRHWWFSNHLNVIGATVQIQHHQGACRSWLHSQCIGYRRWVRNTSPWVQWKTNCCPVGPLAPRLGFHLPRVVLVAVGGHQRQSQGAGRWGLAVSSRVKPIQALHIWKQSEMFSPWFCKSGWLSPKKKSWKKKVAKSLKVNMLSTRLPQRSKSACRSPRFHHADGWDLAAIVTSKNEKEERQWFYMIFLFTRGCACCLYVLLQELLL